MKLSRTFAVMLALLLLAAALPALAEEPAVDMNGRVITIAYNWDYVPANTDYVYNPETDAPSILEELEIMKQVEARFNCKIQRINLPWDQRIEQIVSSVMAGDPVADIVLLDFSQILPLAAQNLLQAFDEFVPADADMFTTKEALVSGGTFMNKIYAVTNASAGVDGFFIGVNQDIINDLGLENPVELYQNGEWTWDKFLEIAKGATRDADADGTMDTYGFACWAYDFVPHLVASNNGFFVDETNRKQGLDSANTMEALNFLYKLYVEEKVCYVFNDDHGDYNNNRFAFQNGNAAMFLAQDWMIPEGDAMLSYNYSVVPVPAGPASEGASWMRTVMGACIPAKVENPEQVYMVYEALYSAQTRDEKSQGTIDWLSNRFQTIEDVEMSILVSDTMGKYDSYGGFNGFPFYPAMDAILKEGKTPAQAVEQYKQVAQDAIDEFFKGLE